MMPIDMKTVVALCLAVALFTGSLLSAAADDSADAVTFESLLLEMQNRDALARFPAPDYRQMQASSYNRQSVARDKPGWFSDQDGVSWIREEKVDGKTEWVIMEHDGPGCITRIWTPFFYYRFNDRVGPNIKIYLNGAKEPVINENFIALVTEKGFVPPPFSAFTARAGDLYLPIPFARSCKVTLDNKAFYNIVNYRAYEEGTAVETFTMDGFKASRECLAKVGKELLVAGPRMEGDWCDAYGNLKPGESLSLDMPKGAAAVRLFEIKIDPAQAKANPSILRSTVVKMSFDGQETVWCPLGDFFGSANAINPMETWTRSVTPDGRMICRWVMPYRRSGELSVENLGKEAVRVEFGASTKPWKWDNPSMHFFARWRGDDVQQGHRFSDWNFVDIRGKGVFVGDAWTVLNLAGGWWGEGDEKIYVDGSYDKKFPDHFGTGTEDYYGWAGGVVPTRDDVFSHPYLANIIVGSTLANNPRGFNISTRIRALDAIPFTQRLVFDMEASPGTGQRRASDLLGYSAVSFWYAMPGTTSNRPPLPREAGKPIISLEALQHQSTEISRAKVRTIPGAIEFETLKPSAKSPKLTTTNQRPAEIFKPEQWSGERHLFINPKQPGDFIEFTLSERFKPQRLQIYVTTSFDFGIMKITANGRVIVQSLDLYSERPEVKKVDLGKMEPMNNTIVLRFELVALNPQSRGEKDFMGLDCLLVESE